MDKHKPLKADVTAVTDGYIVDFKGRRAPSLHKVSRLPDDKMKAKCETCDDLQCPAVNQVRIYLRDGGIRAPYPNRDPDRSFTVRARSLREARERFLASDAPNAKIAKYWKDLEMSSKESQLRLGKHKDLHEGCERCGGLGWIGYGVPRGHADFGKLFPCKSKSHGSTGEEKQ